MIDPNNGLLDLSKLGKKFVEPVALPGPNGEAIYIPLSGIGYIPQDILQAIAIAVAQIVLPNIMNNIEALLTDRQIITSALTLPHHPSQSPDGPA